MYPVLQMLIDHQLLTTPEAESLGQLLDNSHPLEQMILMPLWIKASHALLLLKWEPSEMTTRH